MKEELLSLVSESIYKLKGSTQMAACRELSVYSQLKAASLHSLSRRTRVCWVEGFSGVSACNARRCMKQISTWYLCNSITLIRFLKLWSFIQQQPFGSPQINREGWGGFYWISLKNTTCLIRLHVTINQQGLNACALPGLAYARFCQKCLSGVSRLFFFFSLKPGKAKQNYRWAWTEAAEANSNEKEKYRSRSRLTAKTNKRQSIWHVYGVPHRIWIFL